MAEMYNCVDCGKELPRKELNRRFRCQDCRVKILQENMGQLMAHEGPHYEKWKQAMQASVSRL